MSNITTPLVFAAIGTCIILFVSFFLNPFVFICMSIFCATLGVIGLNCSQHIWRKRGLNCIGWAMGLLLGIVLLYAAEYETGYFVSGIDLSQINSYKGYLVADSEPIQENVRLCRIQLISVTGKGDSFVSEAHGTVQLYIENSENLYAGQIIAVHGSLKRSRKDFIHHINSWVKANDVKMQSYISWFHRLRYSILQWCENSIKMMGSSIAPLFKALFLGDRSELDPELKRAFYNTGTVHLLALSGLHVGIVFAFFGMVLFPISTKRIKIIVGSLFVLGYLCLIGPKPALLRASLMLIMGGTAVLLHRDLHLFNILGLSLIIAVCLDPASVYTLSFAFSYCAVLGILVLGSKLNTFLIPYLPSFFRVPLSVSIGAQIATLPLVLMHFNQFFPLSFLVTLVLVPFITAFIWMGIIFLLFTLIPFFPFYKLLSFLMSGIYEIIRLISNFFSQIPILKLEWQYWYWLPFITLVSLLYIPRQRRKSCEL